MLTDRAAPLPIRPGWSFFLTHLTCPLRHNAPTPLPYPTNTFRSNSIVRSISNRYIPSLTNASIGKNRPRDTLGPQQANRASTAVRRTAAAHRGGLATKRAATRPPQLLLLLSGELPRKSWRKNAYSENRCRRRTGTPLPPPPHLPLPQKTSPMALQGLPPPPQAFRNAPRLRR